MGISRLAMFFQDENPAECERVDSESVVGDELFDDRSSTVANGGGPTERYTVSRSIGVAVMRAGVPMQPEIPVHAALPQITRAAALLATLSGLGQVAHAVELRPGDILVADSFANSLIHIDPASGVQTQVAVDGNLAFPKSLVLEAAGTILIGDSVNDSIVRIDPITGNQAVVSSGGELTALTAIDVGPDGTIYVLEFDKIVAVDPINGAQRVVATNSSIGNASLVVEANGVIVVGDNSLLQRGIVRVDPDTGATTTVISNDSYRDIALFPNGDLLVLDTGFGSFPIRRIDLTTLDATLLGRSFASNPFDVAAEATGNVVVTDNALNSVERLRADTGQVEFVSVSGFIDVPADIIVVPAGVFVSDSFGGLPVQQDDDGTDGFNVVDTEGAIVASASGELVAFVGVDSESGNSFVTAGSSAGTPVLERGTLVSIDFPGVGATSGPFAERFASPQDLSGLLMSARVREDEAPAANGISRGGENGFSMSAITRGSGEAAVRYVLRDADGNEAATMNQTLSGNFESFAFQTDSDFNVPVGGALSIDLSRILAIAIEFSSAVDASPARSFAVDDVLLVPEPPADLRATVAFAVIASLARRRARRDRLSR